MMPCKNVFCTLCMSHRVWNLNTGCLCNGTLRGAGSNDDSLHTMAIAACVHSSALLSLSFANMTTTEREKDAMMVESSSGSGSQRDDDVPYVENSINSTLLDPPRFGWTAAGGVADLLPPHEVRLFQLLFLVNDCELCSNFIL
jgi:hypothetical protein